MTFGGRSATARELLLGEQHPRADAERNVDALIAAARALVISGNLDPAAAEIAAKAGVGVGTLYRRVVRKESLLAAVLVDLLEEVSASAMELAADAEADWESFENFAADYVRIRQVTCAINRGLDEEFDGAVAAAVARTRRAFATMTDELRGRRILAGDVSADDVAIALASIAPTAESLGIKPNAKRTERAIRRLITSLRYHASA